MYVKVNATEESPFYCCRKHPKRCAFCATVLTDDQIKKLDRLSINGPYITYVITKKRSKYFETFLGQSKRYVAVQTTLMVTQFNIGL